jgi:hypothetical protein
MEGSLSHQAQGQLVPGQLWKLPFGATTYDSKKKKGTHIWMVYT